ncbi:MAG TPA: hypothetical protein DDW76_37555 [Cyanobacteria bacterium UBA11369]|nr:hypothetical protein [Cyanobacteria bacterium UBA8553]HAZ44680.1 hypothetical protein [Cyanobacteria bacterium UBA11371]HBE34036.1 hypothetical protein [Cyanobacteria bacterium UBA11368]HBE54307.1 hypothetical protein [Cyanobacteria bacterium UBA11369]
MKLKQWLLHGSRKLHRWIGLYIVVLTLIWVVEAIALPPIFSAGLPGIDNNIPVETTTKKADSPLSLEQAMQAFMAQHPKGIQSFDEVDEIDYFPGMDIYRFENTKRFFQWYLDARDGSLIKYGFNASQFLEQQGFLGWLHPWIGNPIKLSSTLLTLILVGSGFVLFLSPFLARAK